MLSNGWEEGELFTEAEQRRGHPHQDSIILNIVIHKQLKLHREKSPPSHTKL